MDSLALLASSLMPRAIDTTAGAGAASRDDAPEARAASRPVSRSQGLAIAMDATRSFVRNQNVARFVARLEAEPDPRRRETLRQLLVHEVDLHGDLMERLQIVERQIASSRNNIARQTTLAASLQVAEAKAQGERVLANMQDLLVMFEGFRRVLLDRLQRLDG